MSEITRRTFFKIVSAGIAAFTLVKIEGDLPEELLPEPITATSVITENIEVFLENDGWYKSWFRFPCFENMNHEQKEHSWIDVRIGKLSILQAPSFLIGSDGKWQLPMSIGLRDGQYLVAYLHTEKINHITQHYYDERII